MSLIRKDMRLLCSPQFLMILMGLEILIVFTTRSTRFIGPLFALFLMILIDWEDVRENRVVFLNSLPIERKNVVQAKYIEGILLAVIANLTVFPLLFVENLVFNDTGFWVAFTPFCMGVSITLFILAFYYPLLIAFGRAVPFVVLIAVTMLMTPFLYYMDQITNSLLLAIVLLGFVLVYGFSYFPALWMYRKKDF